MSKTRLFAAVLMIMLMAAVLWGCGKHRRHSAYDQPPANEIKIKGQVDGSLGGSRGVEGASD